MHERDHGVIREYCIRETACALPCRVNSRGMESPRLCQNSVCEPQIPPNPSRPTLAGRRLRGGWADQ